MTSKPPIKQNPIPNSVISLVVTSAAVWCGILGASIALAPIPSYSQYLERRQHESGWLPVAEQVVHAEASAYCTLADGEGRWISVDLAEQDVPEIISLLARRTATREPRPSWGEIIIKLKTTASPKPVYVTLTKTPRIQIGGRWFQLPADDARALYELARSRIDSAIKKHGLI